MLASRIKGKSEAISQKRAIKIINKVKSGGISFLSSAVVSRGSHIVFLTGGVSIERSSGATKFSDTELTSTVRLWAAMGSWVT